MTDAMEPAWATYDQVIAIQSRQLRRFGGAPGLRGDGMLCATLERPVNKWHHEQADLPELAAAYGFGLAKNHAFVDGNKRIKINRIVVVLDVGLELLHPQATMARAISRSVKPFCVRRICR